MFTMTRKNYIQIDLISRDGRKEVIGLDYIDVNNGKITKSLKGMQKEIMSRLCKLKEGEEIVISIRATNGEIELI